MRQVLASGTIYTSRFVKLDTTADNKINQCGANGLAMGISSEATRIVPLSDLVTGTAATEAAQSGEELRVYEPNEVCLLCAGDVFGAGVILKSDGNGKGVAAGAGEYGGAISYQASTAANQLILVRVQSLMTLA
jgi:hypothetical protein